MPKIRKTAGRAAWTTATGWLVLAVAPVVLLALLFVAQPASALSSAHIPAAALGSAGPAPAAAEADEEEVEETETEEEETEEEESEEGEDEIGADEEEGGEAETGSLPPEECLLQTVRSRVFTDTSRNRVRLILRYTSFASTEVGVDFKLTGSKGSLGLGRAKQRFTKKGVFRLTSQLSESKMERVRAAKSFTVDLSIPAAPSYCQRFYTRHLSIRRAAHSQVVWLQSDSIFGTGL